MLVEEQLRRLGDGGLQSLDAGWGLGISLGVVADASTPSPTGRRRGIVILIDVRALQKQRGPKSFLPVLHRVKRTYCIRSEQS